MQGVDRLHSRAEFQVVFSQGRSYGARFLALYVLETGSKSSRIGFTTARKIGSNVKRNRVKRRLREIVRSVEYEVKPGYSLVLVGRYSAAEASFQELKADVLRLLGKAGVLKGEV